MITSETMTDLDKVNKQTIKRYKTTNILLQDSSKRKNINRKIHFDTPISPQDAIANFRYYLFGEDFYDIEDYDEIYYLERNPEAVMIQNDRHYIYFNFNKGCHIGFRYEQVQLLGRGSFGSVIKCIDHKTKQYVAVKALADSADDHQQIVREVEFLKILSKHKNGSRHNNICEILDTFYFRGFIFIVTKYYEDNLYDKIKENNYSGFDLEKVRYLGKEIAKALSFTHSAGIVHSDIKPENILLHNHKVYLIDFGCSCYDGEPLYETVQSLYYRAPEVVFSIKYNKSIDVWSFGCLLYELFTGKPLFWSSTESDLISQIVNIVGEPPKEMVNSSRKMKRYFYQKKLSQTNNDEKKKTYLKNNLKNASPEFIDLISQCICWNPTERVTMNDVLNHPFFKK